MDIKACLILPLLIRLSSVEKFGSGSFSNKFSLASSSFSFFLSVSLFSSIDTTVLSFSFLYHFARNTLYTIIEDKKATAEQAKYAQISPIVFSRSVCSPSKKNTKPIMQIMLVIVFNKTELALLKKEHLMSSA